MRIALAQINPTIGAIAQNTALIRRFYQEARSRGADLVIFPELAVTGYPPKDLLLYRGFIDRTAAAVDQELATLSAQEGGAMLVGVPYRGGVSLYNAALLLAGGVVREVIPKTLLPNYDVFDEKRYFTRATEQRTIALNGITAGITVCEDIWNDKDFWPRQLYETDPVEELSRLGARLLLNLSASPYHFGKQAQRERMLSFQARKHGAAILYVNTVGGNDELIFDGVSLVYNDHGDLIRRGAPFAEDLLFVDTEELFVPATAPLPESREDMESVYLALTLGIRDYLAKTGFSTAVLGLSGGVDSAVTAVLAAEALGEKNVLGVLMPSPYSSDHSISDAGTLAQNLGIPHRIIPIHKPLEAFSRLLNKDGKLRLDLAEENLQARLRGNILMFISNRESHLVLTTGNKSELAAGYSTLYGDMAGGLAVLADIPKVMVYELARFINYKHGWPVIPENILIKPPSAELRPDQKDEDSLPPYAELDPILSLYIEEYLSPEEIIARGHPEETVRRTISLVDRAEYKRRQAAPGLRVTTRAFGSGWRMPIARG